MNKKLAATTGDTVMSGGNRNGYPNHITSPRPGRRFPVYNIVGRVVGHVDGDSFLKKASGSRHMLREPRGWAMDTSILADLRVWGVTDVRVTDTDTGAVYVASLAEFEAHGVAFNRGFGPQVVLPLGYWTINGEPPALAQPQPDPNAGRQLALFGEDA